MSELWVGTSLCGSQNVCLTTSGKRKTPISDHMQRPTSASERVGPTICWSNRDTSSYGFANATLALVSVTAQTEARMILSITGLQESARHYRLLSVATIGSFSLTSMLTWMSSAAREKKRRTFSDVRLYNLIAYRFSDAGSG